VDIGRSEPDVPGIRCSDGERGAAVERLKQAFAEGRLHPDELDVRVQQAMSATTRGELASVLGDLPRSEERDVPTKTNRPSRKRVLAAVLVVAALAGSVRGITHGIPHTLSAVLGTHSARLPAPPAPPVPPLPPVPPAP
jgi:hypothetical protein